MYLLKYNDLAFGTDHGMSIQDLIEEQEKDVFTLEDIYVLSDLKKYIDKPSLLKERTDSNVCLNFKNFVKDVVHYEDIIIVIAVLILEADNNVNHIVSLESIGGVSAFKFVTTNEERQLIYDRLDYIIANPNEFILFEFCESYLDELLSELNEVLTDLGKTF